MVLVAVGSTMVAAEPDHLPALGEWLLDRAGVVLLWLAVVVALLIALPRRSRVVPLLLAAVGLFVWLLQRNVPGTVVAGFASIGLGAAFAVVRLGDQFHDDVDPVHTYWRLGSHRPIVATETSDLPRQLRLRAFASFGEYVDLRAAEPGQSDLLEIVLTCWFSRVVIALPPGWAVVAGRVAATRRVRFTGELDESTLITDMDDPRQANQLRDLARRRAGAYGLDVGDAAGVVIHVAGVLSSVRLARR